jgi:hypothetical protein
MTAQQGFVYERNVANFLKRYTPEGFQPAGSGSEQPDLVLQRGRQKTGVELKITAASAGSLVLKHTDGNWGFDALSQQDKEKKFLMDIAKSVNLFSKIKQQWKKLPLKRTPESPLLRAQKGRMTKEQIYRKDLTNFPDIKGPVLASVIERYYHRKQTYYVNVGTHGFYLLGKQDPMKYNKRLAEAKMELIPTFGEKATAIYRARVQYKGGGNYQFTFEIQFAIASKNKSIYNIGAIRLGNVAIDKSQSNISFL